MKAMNLVTGMFLGAALILTGCGSKNTQDNTSMGSRGGARSGTAGSATSAITAAQLANDQDYTQKPGQIDINWNAGNYTNLTYGNMMMNLLSATVSDTSGLGTIADNSAAFTGVVNINSDGTMNAAQSAIEIDITTSVSSTPIPLYILGKASGSSVSGNKATLVFGDDYGTVTLVGTFDVNNNFTGDFQYDNKGDTHVVKGVLNFSIPTCGFFMCYNQ